MKTKVSTKKTRRIVIVIPIGIRISTVPGLDEKMSSGLTVREFLGSMTRICLEKYNKRKGFNVKFERVLRANFNPGGRTKYYITFAARESDSPDSPLVEYQAKLIWSAGNTYPRGVETM